MIPILYVYKVYVVDYQKKVTAIPLGLMRKNLIDNIITHYDI